MVPAQLTTVCKMARLNPRPYHVEEVQLSDIDVWESVRQHKGILRECTSEAGQKVYWRKFIARRVLKGEVDSIHFKYSHTDAEFDAIRTSQIQRSLEEVTEITLQPLYQNALPKLSLGKYQDLKDLCTGTTPVVWHPAHQAFYEYLTHK